MSRRVVVTGMGTVSPLGLDLESSWKALVAGENACGPITAFDVSEFPVKIACELKGFDPEAYQAATQGAGGFGGFDFGDIFGGAARGRGLSLIHELPPPKRPDRRRFLRSTNRTEQNSLCE